MKLIKSVAFVLLGILTMPILAQSTRAIDEVIAIVDTSLITRLELEARTAQIEKQLKANNRPLPAAEELKRQVLERLISERIQQQLAKEYGIKVNDRELDRIIINIAGQNKLTVDAFRAKVEKDGTAFNKYREELRKEVQMARLREREVDARIQVSESEIDSFIAAKNKPAANGPREELYLAQIFLGIPSGASDAEIANLKTKAEDLLKQAGAERDFIAFGKKIAVAGSGLRFEDLGYRTTDRLPQLFVEVTQNIGGNQFVPAVVKSGAGFHIIKVVDRKGVSAAQSQTIVVTQTHSRHILLRHKQGVTDAEMQRRLNSFKEQIKVKAIEFDQAARKYSEDGSAPQGGDLGWMSPGELVPAFEQAMNQLGVGEVSDPVRTEFGWHLIQVIERRQAQLSAEKQREFARAALRERKLEEAYEDWLRQIRDAATVEIRQPQ
jgi:peptidyl-prolyl cis-trans isomerase SurA